MKDTESFHRVNHRGKGGRRGLKKYQVEGPQANLNRYQVLEEEEEGKRADQGMEGSPEEKEKEEDKEQSKDNNKQKEAMMRDVELDMD